MSEGCAFESLVRARLVCFLMVGSCRLQVTEGEKGVRGFQQKSEESHVVGGAANSTFPRGDRGHSMKTFG